MNTSNFDNSDTYSCTFKTQIQTELQRTDFSSLSESVKNLLSVLQCGESINVDFQLNTASDSLLHCISNYLHDFTKTDPNYYVQVLAKIAPLLKNIKYALLNACPRDFVENNSSKLQWLCVPIEELVYNLSNAQSTDVGIQYCAGLCMTSILERSLQDLHWTDQGSSPTVLKDLLSSETLSRLLGDDAMILLDILVGPPTSLNIRNMFWHGFGSVDEDIEQYSLIIFFTCIFVGTIIFEKGIITRHRSFVKLDSPASQLADQPLIIENIALTTELSQSIAKITCKSTEIQQAVDFAEEGKYGHATIMLLTSFEQLMRVAFCIYNSCPARMMTAVNNEFFTTLDHIFNEFLTDGSRNVLHDLLPGRLRSALYDLLYHQHGLRLRDRLSHMEVSYLDITKDIWCYTFNILSATILYTIFDGSTNDCYSHLLHHYSPKYHPLSVLHQTLSQFKADLMLIRGIEPPGHFDVEVISDESLSGACSNLLSYFKYEKNLSVPFSVAQLVFCELQPLHRSRTLSSSSSFALVAEWCKWLQSVCSNALQTVSIILNFSSTRQTMLENKTLRSRQRKNLITFFGVRSMLIQILDTMYSICVVLMNKMCSSEHSCVIQKCHKAFLQLAENIHSLVEQNKWTNLIDFFTTFVNSNFS